MSSMAVSGQPGTVANVTLRALREDDAEALRRLFFRLSPSSVYYRFFQSVRAPSDAALHHLASVDHLRREAIAAVASGEIVGVARYERMADDPSRAEVAIVVEDGWQGRGLGKLLLSTLAVKARQAGVTTFTATVLGDNRRMLSLARALAPATRARFEEGFWDLEIPLQGGMVAPAGAISPTS
jgi:GNAT superfamily N-acetyltransferase